MSLIIRVILVTLMSFNIPNNASWLEIFPLTNGPSKVSKGIVERRSIKKLPVRYSFAIVFGLCTSSPSSPVMVVLNTIMISTRKQTSMAEFSPSEKGVFVQSGLKVIWMGSVMPLYNAHIIMNRSQIKWTVLFGERRSFFVRLISTTGLLSFVAASKLTLFSFSAILAN